jgi:DNA mismatch repair ATPase MutS
LDYIEWYLRNQRIPLKNNVLDAAFDSIKNILKQDRDYYIISQGILHIIRLLNEVDKFIVIAKSTQIGLTLNQDFDKVILLLNSKFLRKVRIQSKDLSFFQINRLDFFFRVLMKDLLREVLDIIYKIDILQTLSRLVKKDGFTLPEYHPSYEPFLDVIDVIHPFLDSPVPNSYRIDMDANLCFITGPNMSGKSTFLKSMGVLIYLAHLGFPVPARKLTTSIFDGIFTTINLTDNLNLGYSHFYSEVKRLKELIVKIKPERKLLFIFDELFRGTNVKDAFDSSLMIISLLSKIKNNFFFVSSHILEVAENICNEKTIMFRCFQSDLIGQQFVYDFKLKFGVSNERNGLMIIKNESIIELLEKIIENQKKC